MRRSFYIVTDDGSGLGWASRLQDEGEDVTLVLAPHDDDESKPLFLRLGSGLVKTKLLPDALRDTPDTGDYWIFSTNCQSAAATALRRRGAKVFGAESYCDDLEHDRAYAMQMAGEAGLALPDMHAFADLPSGVAFLQSHADRAYVFKPDDADASHLTFVPRRIDPQDANDELQQYLAHLNDPAISSYVLQERHQGIEVCFNLWMSKGTPILGECTLENKRQLTGDVGENGPCSQDVVWTLPLDAKGLTETAGKLVPLMGDYTGFLDANVIVGDREAWFLETGCRFGYNAHPNLFMTLALDPFGDLMADWMDGKTDGFANRFRHGFGASVSLRLDHPREGLPLHIGDKYRPFYYPYDVYQNDGQLLLTGYSHDVGIYARHGATIREAGERVIHDLEQREAVSFPDMGFRNDVADADYVQAPQRRYDALQAMDWLR